MNTCLVSLILLWWASDMLRFEKPVIYLWVCFILQLYQPCIILSWLVDWFWQISAQPCPKPSFKWIISGKVCFFNDYWKKLKRFNCNAVLIEFALMCALMFSFQDMQQAKKVTFENGEDMNLCLDWRWGCVASTCWKG